MQNGPITKNRILLQLFFWKFSLNIRIDPLIDNWVNAPFTQIVIFILSASAWALFERVWVSLKHIFIVRKIHLLQVKVVLKLDFRRHFNEELLKDYYMKISENSQKKRGNRRFILSKLNSVTCVFIKAFQHFQNNTRFRSWHGHYAFPHTFSECGASWTLDPSIEVAKCDLKLINNSFISVAA